MSPRIEVVVCWAASAAAVLALLPPARSDEVVAVASRVNQAYVRTKLPDGSFQAESYSFGKGGYSSGDLSDKTIESMSFLDVAHVVTGPLASQKYIPGHDPKTTQLLIMVYWGTTRTPASSNDAASYQNYQQAQQTLSADRLQTHGVRGNTSGPENQVDSALPGVAADDRMRNNMNERNAALLGYNSWWDQYVGLDHRGTALEYRKQEMLSELEEQRYYVILMAYDFQKLWKNKKPVLLWETRSSINERRNAFDQQLGRMVVDASKYFGQDTLGLVRKPVADGRVDIGVPQSLGTVP